MKKEKNDNGYLWNTLAGVVNASEAVLLSMAVTRTDGLEDAGILSIAFATGNLFMTIGKSGVRNYQATDVEETFSFSDYFMARMLTVSAMLLISMVYMLYCIHWKDYGFSKASVVLSICFIYAVESVEDVFWGKYQQKQALDLGAAMFVFRWMAILAVFIICLFSGMGLQQAAAAGAAVSVPAFFALYFIAERKFRRITGIVRQNAHLKSITADPQSGVQMHFKAALQILKKCFPLAAVAFMAFYITNAPKYAIDRYLPEDVQACYGFIAMPVFVIEMLNSFLYQPSLVQMALEWKEQNMNSFSSRIRKQCVILAGLSVICLAGAYACGIPVLSVLYGTDLNAYRTELFLLVLGGGMLAYVGYFSVLLTIMRKQIMIMYGYAGVLVLTVCFSNPIVKYFQITGAAIFFDAGMAVLAVFFYFICRREVKNNHA